MMKKAAKIVLCIIGATVTAVLLLLFSINALVCAGASSHFVSDNDAEIVAPDIILVFGCGLNADKTPGKMLADRMETAIGLYNTYGCKLLLSGDGTSPYYNEPEAMKHMALEYGVHEEDIINDPEGISTIESVRRAKDVFGAEKVVVVTQKYHLYRAVYIARELGMEAYGAKADSPEYKNRVSMLVREVFARVKDYFLIGQYK